MRVSEIREGSILVNTPRPEYFSANCHAHHDLVCDFGGRRPEIWVLCGSARFQGEINRIDAELSSVGKLVLSYGGFGHTDERVLTILSELHRRKIDLADHVFVVNVNGYVGSGTRSEIEYARRIGRPITYLEPPAQV